MFAYFSIFFLVLFYSFLLADFQAAMNIGSFISHNERAPDNKKILIVPNDLLIHAVECAFGHREIMYGIQKVGFSRSIIPNKAINVLGKWYIEGIIVFEID